MEETAVDAAGAKPLEPLLHRFTALESKRDLAAFLAHQQLATYGSGWLFGFGSDQDFSDATKVIAFARAGGLGLPDRDYYTKNDARSKDLRDKYVAHVARMLELAGESNAEAAKDAATVMSIETALAKASLTRVQRRDPYNLFHKMTPAELQKITPSFDWKRHLAATGLHNVKMINVTEPGFFKEMQREIKSASLADWKAYLRWHAVHAQAPYQG